MANKLYEELDVQAIAKSIRFKNKTETTYKISKMDDGVIEIPMPNIPKHHYEEAIRVSNNILNRKTNNCLVFGAITDNHINIGESYERLSKTSIQHGAFALELISNFINSDFIVNLGDNQWSNDIDTENAIQCGEYLKKIIAPGFKKHQSFRLVGNHDQTENNIQKQWELIGQYNQFDNIGLTRERCYGYKDFSDKKIRVIFLNTSDYLNGTGGYGISYEQKDFLMSSLDLSNKSDCSEWKIILLSHIPLDFYSTEYNITSDIIGILQAYSNGTSISIQVRDDWKNIHDDVINKTVLTYDYNGKNQAKIIANIHGHLHNDCFGKLGYDNITTDIVRIATPNTCYYLAKDNSYPNNGDYSAELINKTENTANDTSVTFYIVDLTNDIIYSYAYGAGNDRVIPYVFDKEVYTITYNLTNCTSSTMIDTSIEGTSYSTTITLNDGATLSTVSVIMGGVDITSTAYNNGIITIENINGNIEITVIAEIELPYTNLFDQSALAIDQATGKPNTRFTSGGIIRDGTAWCMETFLPCKAGDVIRIYCPNAIWTDFGYRIICTYTEANVESHTGVDIYQNSTSYGVLHSEDGHTITITIPDGKMINYYRVSGGPTGTNHGNVIITQNEEI